MTCRPCRGFVAFMTFPGFAFPCRGSLSLGYDLSALRALVQVIAAALDFTFIILHALASFFSL
jgi:hypothetical protein